MPVSTGPSHAGPVAAPASEPPPLRWLLRALVASTVALLLAFTLQAWLREVAWARAHGTTYRDSLQFYTGGSLLRMGQPHRLYDLEAQRALQNVLFQKELEPRIVWDFLLFVSLPFVALALAPLTHLDLPTFYLLTGIANWALLALLLVALLHLARSWPEPRRLALLVLALLWFPVSWNIIWGQVSFLLALAFTLALLALRSHHQTLAGLALALLWVKPQYVPLLLPCLLLARQWRAAAAFAAASALLLLLSWAIVGTEGLLSYIHLLRHIESMGFAYAMFPKDYHTLGGFMLRLFGLQGPPWLLLSALLAAGLLVTIGQRGLHGPGYALMVLTAVLVSPHTNLQDLVVLLPVIALGGQVLRARPALLASWFALWSAVALACLLPIYWTNPFWGQNLFTVPAMLLSYGLMLHLAWKAPPLPSPLAHPRGAP